jgi:hypothetical protein
LYEKALSSQLETILDNEQQQQQVTTDHTNETGIGLEGGVGSSFWNSDETYEDYYNEGRHARSYVLHVIVFRQLHTCISLFVCHLCSC